jgi:hypothetical protein
VVFNPGKGSADTGETNDQTVASNAGATISQREVRTSFSQQTIRLHRLIFVPKF